MNFVKERFGVLNVCVRTYVYIRMVQILMLQNINRNVYSKYDLKALKNQALLGFLGGAVVENLPANAGDTGSSPGLGRSHMPRSN